MLLVTDSIRIDAAYADRLRAAELDSVPRALDYESGRVCAWSRSTDTIHVPGCGGIPGFFLKRYKYPTWGRRLRAALRGTFFGEHRAAAERRLLNDMRMLGIPAVRPIAYGARRIAHFLSASFLITEEVPEARNLTNFAAQVASGKIALGAVGRQRFCAALARQIAEIHSAGFVHGQLFWRNILIRVGPSGDAEFFFLDARPRRTGGWVSRQSDWWIEELGHVAASARPFSTRTDRLRFLLTYSGTRQLTPDLRNLIRRIDLSAKRWQKHEMQRIRMSRRFEAWYTKLEEESASRAVSGAGK